jgi:hypothetical protein
MNTLAVTLLAASSVEIGSGRFLPTAAAALGILGIVVGVMALRSQTLTNRRAGAIVASLLGLISLLMGGLHAAYSAGSFGTGNGLAGALVAIVVGLAGLSLGTLALARSPRLDAK